MRTLARLLLALAIAPAAHAAPLGISYSLGSTGLYESFDQIGLGTNAPGQPNGAGWDSFWSLRLTGATPNEQYTSLALPSANPAIDAYNAGPVGGSDRAIGLYTTSNGNPARDMITSIRNDSGAALTAFHLEFDVEFWLQRNMGRWSGLQAFYSADGSTWTNLGNAFEATKVSASNAGFVDGNAAANAVRGVGGLVDLASYGLAPLGVGSTFYLRFSGSSGLTVPGGMSINQNRNVAGFLDNLWVGPTPRPPNVPEPSTALLVASGVGALAHAARRRRRVAAA